MRGRPPLPDLNASHDEEVKMSDRKRAQIRYSSNVMGGDGKERPGERHHNRGKSSLACDPGSRVGEPEKRESFDAISNQVKLPGAIIGRQNRAYFGLSGAGGVSLACSALGTFGRIIIIQEVGVASCMLDTAPRG